MATRNIWAQILFVRKAKRSIFRAGQEGVLQDRGGANQTLPHPDLRRARELWVSVPLMFRQLQLSNSQGTGPGGHASRRLFFVAIGRIE